MQCYKCQCAPLVQDIKDFLHIFRGKEEEARAEVDAFMENCAKRWPIRESTYQFKRRRLLPESRDEGHLIFHMAWKITTWWKRCYEGLRGGVVSPFLRVFTGFRWRSGTTTCRQKCENHVRRLRTFFTVVLEPNIHTFSVLSETLPDFLKSKLC